MATATKKAHAASLPADAVRRATEPVFRTYSDNGGSYHWEIVERDGEILAQSESFASQDEAERAARDLHQGARSASFKSQMAKERDTVVA